MNQLDQLVRCLRSEKLVLGWLLMSCAVTALAAEPNPTRCDEMDASTFQSPDGVWVAKVYGEVCDLGLSSSATVSVLLQHARNTQLKHVVLGMTMPTDRSAWPKVVWGSPDKVTIDLPSNAEIGLQMAYFQGIEVDVLFCPRDPAHRRRWLEYRASYRQWSKDDLAWVEKRKQDPNYSGARPVRPTPPAKVSDPTCSR